MLNTSKPRFSEWSFNSSFQQVNSLEVTPDRSMIAAAGQSKLSPLKAARRFTARSSSSSCRVSAHPHVRPELQQPKPRHQLRRSQQEHHLRGLPWGRTLDVHWRRGLHGSHMGPKVRRFASTPAEIHSAVINRPPFRSRNLQCQRIFQVNAPINCVCLHPNQVSSKLHRCLMWIYL